MSARRLILSIVYTPFQLFVLENLLRSQYIDDDVMLVDQRPSAVRQSRLPEINNIKTSLQIDIPQSFLHAEYLRGVKDVLENISNSCSDYNKIVFLCGNIRWDLCNVVFTFLKRQRRDFFVEMFEDGLTTYLLPKVSISCRVQDLVKIILGRVGLCEGHSYVSNDAGGVFTKDVKAIYVLNTSVFARLPANAVEVRYTLLASAQHDASEGIFLGQPYTRDYGEYYHNVLKRFISHKDEYGVRKWLYKPHHFSSDYEKELFLSNGFRLYNPPGGLEESFSKMNAGMLVSINTTALLTAKLMLGASVRCVAVCPHMFSPPGQSRSSDEVCSLFRRCGVEVIDYV